MSKRVTATSTGQKLQTLVLFGTHSLMCDEPVDLGGDDAGPSPFELLQAALAVCTQMTLQLYAKRKGWDPGELNIVVTFISNVTLGIDRSTMERKIYFAGDLNESQKQRFLEIANKCPVHKVLTSHFSIVSEILKEDSVVK